MWSWFHKWASPKWFYDMSGRWLPWLAGLSALLLVTGTVWGLFFAPTHWEQGDSYRIIYVHVPSAFLAQSAYVLMAVAGAIGLIWKIKLADMVAKSVAPIGASMTALALISGAIWGKPTWGTWWVWDARLTSMLVLMFLYLGYMALQSAIADRNQAAKASSVLALVGVVNIPIIKYSVEWWNTLHQPASLSIVENPTTHIAPSILYPLFIMIIGFNLFFAALLMVRTRIEILDREWRTQWVRQLLADSASVGNEVR